MVWRSIKDVRHEGPIDCSRAIGLSLFRSSKNSGKGRANLQEEVGIIAESVCDASEVDDAIAQLVDAYREREFYPVVAWFETSHVSERHVITASDREEAAQDMDLLQELLHAGMARLFLDEQCADLLADPACRFMIRTYVTCAAARSQNTVTDFDYS